MSQRWISHCTRYIVGGATLLRKLPLLLFNQVFIDTSLVEIHMSLSSRPVRIGPRIIIVKEALAGPLEFNFFIYTTFWTIDGAYTEAPVLPFEVFWLKFILLVHWSYVLQVRNGDITPWDFFYPWSAPGHGRDLHLPVGKERTPLFMECER